MELFPENQVLRMVNIYDRDIFDGEIYRLGPVNDDKFILEENDIIYGESSLVPEGIARTVCVGEKMAQVVRLHGIQEG